MSCGHAESVIRNMYSSVSTLLSQDVTSFLLVGKDRTSPSKPVGLHTLLQVSLAVKKKKKEKAAGFTSQKNVPCLQIQHLHFCPGKQDTFSTILNCTQEIMRKARLVSISLQLLPSNWPSTTALRQGQQIAPVGRSWNDCWSPHYALL